ncbi:GNAT family N-acetyltransferase [Streptomyces sp. bgisy153]|uniref:GNAT family N-acetyltransferase n=1 Tax=Streptomyces sp. bgisy153 TaxID=3413793 RepID=UPI003D7059A5
MDTDRTPAPAPAPELHGHGLRLCTWDVERDDHVEAWWHGQRDPEFKRWNTPLVFVTDMDSSRDSLRRWAERTADGEGVAFRVADAASGTTLGQISVSAVNRTTRSAIVGYWVLPEARGHGVATRALRLMARWALADFGLHRLELGHAVGHEVSCRVAEKCGFRYEGTLRGAMFEAGRRDAFRDTHLHARLTTDPEPNPNPAPNPAPNTDPEQTP